MPYQVEFLPRAIDNLSSLDSVVAQRILNKLRWLSENFDTLTPEMLTGELKGLLKLRVGNYRVIYSANEKAHLIIVHFIGHRKDIYK